MAPIAPVALSRSPRLPESRRPVASRQTNKWCRNWCPPACSQLVHIWCRSFIEWRSSPPSRCHGCTWRSAFPRACSGARPPAHHFARREGTGETNDNLSGQPAPEDGSSIYFPSMTQPVLSAFSCNGLQRGGLFRPRPGGKSPSRPHPTAGGARGLRIAIRSQWRQGFSPGCAAASLRASESRTERPSSKGFQAGPPAPEGGRRGGWRTGNHTCDTDATIILIPNVFLKTKTVVPRDGIEPPTRRFSVACSTN